MKPWLQDNDIEIYSTNAKGKSAVAERFIRTVSSKCLTNTLEIKIASARHLKCKL